MFYRILLAPPGYSPHEKYSVCAYESMDPLSRSFDLKKSDGTRFAATLEEARRMIPDSAKPCGYGPIDQFLEVWEA